MNKKITIGLTGSGTGGHFYPLIAVAESLRSKIPEANLLFFAPAPYDQTELDRLGLHFVRIMAGKRRNYFSLLNFLDFFKISFGIIEALFKIFRYYPDVIFSKGGYAAFPTLVAARIFRIPIIVHDSDTIPGRVTTWSEKFARRVSLSWPESLEYITNAHKALIGNPVRRSLLEADNKRGRALLGIPKEIPVILILGGSQGAEIINNAILEALPKLTKDFYILHQAGDKNVDHVSDYSQKLFATTGNVNNYKVFGSLNSHSLAQALAAADIVVTRAGASGLFETAVVGKVPAIIIPIEKSSRDHQRSNAYAYAKTGAGVVIEEPNFTPEVIVNEIKKILVDRNLYERMKKATLTFAPFNAADKIAEELIQIATEHE